MEINNLEPKEPILVLPDKRNTSFLVRSSLVLLFILVGAIVCFLALQALTKDSLPGESLYTYKTNIVEKITAQTKLSQEKRIAYEMRRLEKRVAEINTLAIDTSSSSEESLIKISELVKMHTETVLTKIQSDTSLSVQEKTNIYATLATLTRTIEIVTTDSTEFLPIKKQVSEVENTANDALKSQIRLFVEQNDTEALNSFMTEQITYVSEHIPALAYGSTAQRLATDRVSNTQEAIAAKDMVSAITNILRAKQAIEVDGYLWDAERGPVSGSVPEPAPMPEGS